MSSKSGLKMRAFVHKRGSLILTVIAVGGVAVTTVLAARGGLKADDILKERDQNLIPEVSKEEDGNPELNTWYPPSMREIFDLTWQCYIPAAISGAITIAAIIGSQYISAKQIAALTASVSMLVASRDQLEQAIRDKYGEEGLNELRSKMKLFKPEKEYIRIYAEETGKGDLLCYDRYSGRWFRSEEDEVKKAIKEYSDMFKQGLYLSLNDLYRLYGIDETDFGFQYGYAATEMCYDFEDGIPMYVSRMFEPKYGEDVLYIFMGDPGHGGAYAVLPMECWLEY